jgi:5-oxoprolinase (ATP-hydrolysing)
MKGKGMAGGYRIGIDIGGTFTDFVLLNHQSGELRLHKCLTTPADPAEGALAGLEELVRAHGITLADCDTLVHGTTLVTNAVIERSGAPTALLTTQGFRDILAMGKEQRYDIYALFLRFPEPLVPRRWRVAVAERMSRDGVPLQTPALATVRGQVACLVDQGVEAIAICFLHAYRNPEHERAVAELIRTEFPRLAVSVSSEVVPEIREYERTATTVCNAYVQPLMDRYLGRMEGELAQRGFAGQFHLMQSSGGLASPQTARRFPIRLLESGPAGGAMVGAFLGRAVGLPDLITFDMGGTTAKTCLISCGKPDLAGEIEAARVHRFKRGSGLPIKTPVLDLMEIGAGGGSIARRNELGLLQVGPHSAGADPGPACYGRGGTEPTVTDACLALGYLDPDYFLGGALHLDVAAANRALSRLARSLDLTTQEAAWGVYSVVCETMASAARVHIIEKGRDPRRFPIIAFGGAGPVVAGRVARVLGVGEVIVPPVSGVASALGLLVAPISVEFSRSYPAELHAVDWTAVNRLYTDMEQQASQTLAGAGVAEHAIHLERRAEMRLSGQFHDIEVIIPCGPLAPAHAPEIAERFAHEYERLYHAVLAGYEILILNWRLRASGPTPEFRLPAGAVLARSGTQTRARQHAPSSRPAYFAQVGGFVATTVYDRYHLRPGERIVGPAIVEERESTTILAPEDALTVDALGNLRISVGGRA